MAHARLAGTRIADVDARIAELTALRGQLTDLLVEAEGYRTPKETA